MSFEQLPKVERHSPINSEVTASTYAPQETSNSCGVATMLMARNLLTGPTYPHTVTETLEIMKQKGYPEEALGRTSSRDRGILISQLNTFQEVRMVRKVLEMPEDPKAYFDQLEQVLNEGAVVMLGFAKPYFELPNGVEIEEHPKIFHGVLIHGIKKGQDGERIFIVTDPEPKIASLLGMNIEVNEGKLMDSLSNYSKKEIEAIFTAI